MPETERLADLLARKQFVVTAEVTPPLAASADRLRQRAAPLQGQVDALNVTDAAGARAAMSSVAAAAILLRDGFDPVLQVTCRDRNRIALASDLIGAAALGIGNILVLHGDSPEGGDQPEAKPVYDLDSRGVMALVRQMRDQGTLPSGRKIEPAPDLLIGGADTPFDPPADWRPTGLQDKAAAGADFIQTQFCYDPAVAGRYFARLADQGLTERMAFIVGVGPLASARSARWMNDNLFGVTVPESVIARLERAADQAVEGRRICVELIQTYAQMPGIAGVHVMAPQQGAEAIAAVVTEAGVRRQRAA